ncbi:disease resistance protein RGA2-like [Asparagus officinalis]|nr:disease resistance protein RGA2-like [Asparagus officinalis]
MSPDTVTPVDCFALPSLRSLWLVDCGGSDGLTPALLMQGSLTSLLALALRGANHITAFPFEVECRRFTSLRVLRLTGCDELASVECPKLVQAAAAATPASIIKREEEQGFTSTVEELEIDDPFLLHVEPLRKLTSVRRLEIGDGSHLEAALAEPWLLQNSTSLRSLHLWRKAKILPSSLQTLSSLEYLTLGEACDLQSLPQLPLSLRTLMIGGCNETLKERCRENEGADWPNIRHIPDIDID